MIGLQRENSTIAQCQYVCYTINVGWGGGKGRGENNKIKGRQKIRKSSFYKTTKECIK